MRSTGRRQAIQVATGYGTAPRDQARLQQGLSESGNPAGRHVRRERDLR
jgi:hypothetical protein